MSYRARIYLATVMLGGLALIVRALLDPVPPASLWFTCAILGVLATVAQLFKAEGPGNEGPGTFAFFATPVFLFAGVLLLPPPLLVLLVIIPHLVEWGKAHWDGGAHLQAWYIQPFNIAMYILAGSVAQWVYLTQQASLQRLGITSALLPILIAASVYLLGNQLLLGEVLVLAREVSWHESGVLRLKNLLPEWIMLCLGSSVALLWTLDPWLILPILCSLLLMYQALKVPKLQVEAQTDSKTGLLNTRYFNQSYVEEFKRAQRFKRPLAFIMADIDLLRSINNTYGHLAGDAVLIGVAQIIRENIRDGDIAARFGGEEFAIVLPETEERAAKAIAQRIRHAIETASFCVATHATPIKATMSVGIACFPDDAMTTTELSHQADIAVYQAKIQGRNRVICVGEVPHAVTREDLATPAHVGIEYAAAFADTQSTSAPAPAVYPLAPVAEHNPPVANTSPRIDPLPSGTPIEPPTTAVMYPHPARPRSTRLIHLQQWQVLVGVVITMGIGASALGSVFALTVPLPVILVLVVLAVLAECFQVDLYEQGTISVTAGLIFTAGLITGMPGLALVSAVCAVCAALMQAQSQRRRPVWYKIAFNWATHVLAGSVPIVVLAVLDTPLGITTVPRLAVPMGIAALAYYVIETGLIATVISLSTGTRLIITWRTRYHWLMNHYLVLCGVGFFAGVAYTELGLLGLLVFVLPLFTVRYAQKQYVDQTTASVRELQRMNTELTQANREVSSASSAIQELNRQLQQLNDELFQTLGMVLDARDPYVGGHAAQVAYYAAAIAQELGLPAQRVELVRQAGFLHDLGKIGIAEQILHKPSKLTAAEYEIMKMHAGLGAQILELSGGLRHLAPFVRSHHERWDGRGYPDGLSGESIALEARILNVCDSVEAMASDRPYHAGMRVTDIIAEVRQCANTQFDPAVAAAFLRLVEREGEAFVVNSAHAVQYKHLNAESHPNVQNGPISDETIAKGAPGIGSIEPTTGRVSAGMATSPSQLPPALTV